MAIKMSQMRLSTPNLRIKWVLEDGINSVVGIVVQRYSTWNPSSTKIATITVKMMLLLLTVRILPHSFATLIRLQAETGTPSA